MRDEATPSRAISRPWWRREAGSQAFWLGTPGMRMAQCPSASRCSALGFAVAGGSCIGFVGEAFLRIGYVVELLPGQVG